MADIDYNALFGVEASEKEPEAAEPAKDPKESAGANEQEPAKPADEKPEQTKEDNAAFAAARRKAERERDEAVSAAKADADEYIAQAFKKAGIVNPYTGKMIESKADFEAYRAAMDNEQKSKMLDRSGMSEEEYRAFVDNLPEVRDARRIKADAEERNKAEREKQMRADVDRQIAEISALDPGVKTLEDLSKAENYDAFYALVQKGYSLADAYKIANFDTLQGRRSAAAKQAAINAESKSHLQKTASRGQGSLTVPADVMREYKAFCPEATDAEIAAHYNKTYNS